MILFLDFDGVTHPLDDSELHFSRTPYLWDLLRRRPEISVVFSTGWRFVHSLDDLTRHVTEGGGEDLEKRFIDMTPTTRSAASAETGSRELDCLAWLRSQNMERTLWLALDDMPRLFARRSKHLYAVNPETGLVRNDVDHIVEKVKGLAS